MRKIALEDVQPYLPARPLDAHKGMFGHVLVIGGDYGMPGATRLAAEGALRIGAGLVTVVTRRLHVPIVMSGRPELLCYGIDDDFDQLTPVLTKASVIVLGCGLGQSAWSKYLYDQVMASDRPVVLDADALNFLAQDNLNTKPSKSWILTPHPGEAARLLNQTIKTIQSDRLAAVQALQKRYGGVVVLKGSGTLVSSAVDKPPCYCMAGNPAMASAGMGDLLSGIIAGLLGQGLTPWQAAQTGVVLHATAADQVVAQKGARGLVASDLLGQLSRF